MKKKKYIPPKIVALSDSAGILADLQMDYCEPGPSAAEDCIEGNTAFQRCNDGGGPRFD